MSRQTYPEEYREQIVALARVGRSYSSLAREFEPSMHQDSRGVYGAPRIQAELGARGLIAGRHRLTRLMSEQGLRGVSRRRHRSTTKRALGVRPYRRI